MNLLEILNTTASVTWSSKGHLHVGKFKLNDIDYKLQVDEYEVNSKDLLDVGFNREGSIESVGSSRSASRILGAVINGLVPKIQEIDPDVILISVMKSSGSVDSRKSTYDAAIMWVMKKTKMTFLTSEWEENSQGFFKLLSKNKLTADETKLFIA